MLSQKSLAYVHPSGTLWWRVTFGWNFQIFSVKFLTWRIALKFRKKMFLEKKNSNSFCPQKSHWNFQKKCQQYVKIFRVKWINKWVLLSPQSLYREPMIFSRIKFSCTHIEHASPHIFRVSSHLFERIMIVWMIQEYLSEF